MTTQMGDSLVYRGEVFDFLEGLFSPYEHGLQPGADSSDGWRGYVAYYAVRDGRLLLTDLSLAEPEQPLMLDDEGNEVALPPGYPPLNGVEAVRDTSLSGGSWHYHNVDLPLDYTGTLTLCRLPLHQDVPEFWEARDNPDEEDFEHVVRLTVEAGRVNGEQEIRVPEVSSQAPLEPPMPVDLSTCDTVRTGSTSVSDVTFDDLDVFLSFDDDPK